MTNETAPEYVLTLMEEVRFAQSEAPAPLQGWGLPRSQIQAIREAAANHNEKFGPSPAAVDMDTKIKLLMTFEKICRKHGVQVSDAMRLPILEQLIIELMANKEALDFSDASVSKIIAVTAYCGGILPGLANEFSEFSDAPYIFRHAATNHRANPRSFLQNVRRNIAALAADEEFAEFRDAPGVFRQAVINHPANPQEFMRRVQQNIAVLAADEEFAEFRDTPGVFRDAATRNPTDPRAYFHNLSSSTSGGYAKKIKSVREQKSPERIR